MMDLNYNEFLLLWGLYAIIFLMGIGLGYAYKAFSVINNQDKLTQGDKNESKTRNDK